MTTNKLTEKLLAGATIIDVRTADEYGEGCYKGAINIPVNTIPNMLESIGPKDKPVIVYCASGSRSAVATAILKSRGFTDVTNAGGLGNMPTEEVRRAS